MLIDPKWIPGVIVGLCVFGSACGGSETSASAQGGVGGSEAGGSSASGGSSGTGGHQGVFGGNAGDQPSGSGGSALTDASASYDASFCWEDGGRLVTSARACEQDSDCAIIVASHCCGANGAIGILKSEQMAFASCFALPPNACQGLGCASYIGYMTDTGKTTEYDPTVKNQLDLVTVQCIAKVCTTDVVVPDGGRD